MPRVTGSMVKCDGLAVLPHEPAGEIAADDVREYRCHDSSSLPGPASPWVAGRTGPTSIRSLFGRPALRPPRAAIAPRTGRPARGGVHPTVPPRRDQGRDDRQPEPTATALTTMTRGVPR